MASLQSLPPKNNVFMTLLQRNQYLLPKTNDKNQTTRATTPAPAQLPTTPLSLHSSKPQRGVALMYLNAPYYVVGGGGGTPIRIHNAHALWCGIEEKNKLKCCCWCTGFLALLLLNVKKEEHSRNHLDDLASLKARRLGRREDMKWLNSSKHIDIDETRD